MTDPTTTETPIERNGATIESAATSLAALIHPGMCTTINGHDVQRQALRYVIDGTAFAYCIDDAVALVAR